VKYGAERGGGGPGTAGKKKTGEAVEKSSNGCSMSGRVDNREVNK